jgi:hypothetical protein
MSTTRSVTPVPAAIATSHNSEPNASTRRRSDGGPPRRRVVTFFAALGALVAVTIGLGTAPASASPYGPFDASCNNDHSITAEAMDLTTYPGYTAVWLPHLFQWNGSRWAGYRWGPVMTQSSSDWINHSYRFTNLPTGFYQVRDTISWFYNNRNAGGGGADIPIFHHINGSDLQNYTTTGSNSSYCSLHY